MLCLAKITSLSSDDEVCAIVLSRDSEVKEREVHRICARLFDEKVSDIKWDNDAECWTFTLGGKYNAQLEFVDYPLVSL